jgi:hypothetical protein
VAGLWSAYIRGMDEPLRSIIGGLVNRLAQKTGSEIVSEPVYIPPGNSTPVAPVPAIVHPCKVRRDGSFSLHAVARLLALASIIAAEKHTRSTKLRG